MKTAELRMIPVSELKPAEYNPRKKLKPWTIVNKVDRKKSKKCFKLNGR